MNLRIRLLRLTPTEAELAIEPPPGCEVRGRFLGPMCLYSTTIEVAYPVRGGRVVIPEPAWWDPESPFLYEGRLELWRDGAKIGDERVRLGLSHIRREGERLQCNGKWLDLKSQRVVAVDAEAFRRLRAEGFNAVQVPETVALDACELADAIGLLVLTDKPLAIDRLLHPSMVTH